MKVSRRVVEGIKGYSKLNDDDKLWVVDDVLKKLNPNGHTNIAGLLAKTLRSQVIQPHVFLSHSSKDKRFVRNLAAKLEQARIRVWLDEVELKVGQTLIERLREAIDAVDFLIVVLSKSSIESSWVQKEIDIAMNQEIKTKKIKVLPILKERVDLPGFLEGKLYIDFSTQSSRIKSTQKLIEHIKEIAVEISNGPVIARFPDGKEITLPAGTGTLTYKRPLQLVAPGNSNARKKLNKKNQK